MFVDFTVRWNIAFQMFVDFTVRWNIVLLQMLILLSQVEHCISNVCSFYCHRWNIALQMLISLSQVEQVFVDFTVRCNIAL